MRRFFLTSVCLIALVTMAAQALAQIAAPAYVIPVVAKAPGLNDTAWASDLFVTNLGDTAVQLAAHYFKADQANTFDGTFAKTGITLAPGQTIVIRDVVGTWFPSAGGSTKGWMLVADVTPVDCNDEDDEMARLAVSSRTYNDAGAAGTFGQIVEAMWTTVNPSPLPSIITGIRHNGATRVSGAFRTNVGIVNLSTVPITVEITLRRLNGSSVGTVERTIPALSLGQWTLDSLGFAAFPVGSGGRIEAKLKNVSFDPCTDVEEPPVCTDPCDPSCTGGRYDMPAIEVFILYASNVDNISGDGENMISLVDFMQISNWVTQYQETNCPDAAGYVSSLLRSLARQAGSELAKEPTFRKLDD